MINVSELLNRLQDRHEAGKALELKDALDLAEALRERLPAFVDPDQIRYETVDPEATADEVSNLCSAIVNARSFAGLPCEGVEESCEECAEDARGDV